MANFYSELADYMEGEDATLDSIVTGFLPGDFDNCIAIIGIAGTTLFDQRDVPALKFPRFQVLVRNTDFDEAENQMNKVRAVLHGLIGVSLPSFRIMRLHVEQEGGALGQDEQGRFEFGINFTGEIHETV